MLFNHLFAFLPRYRKRKRNKSGSKAEVSETTVKSAVSTRQRASCTALETRQRKAKMQSETSRLVLNELERCENLSATEIQEFVSRLRQAIRREYQAQAVRLKRQNLSTNLSTMHKEERTEKENLPPTPPIREKGKKEEMPPAAATRASRVRGECPSWEQVKERAEVSLKCRDFDWLLSIIEQIVKKRPHSNLFRIAPIKKSRPSLCIECPERQNAPRHRDITTGIL